MDNAVASGIFPGGVVVWGDAGRVRGTVCSGVTDLFTKRPVKEDTFYDLASLTKPLATALAIMYQSSNGGIRIHDTVDRYLPEFSGSQKASISIGDLLSHRSGYPAYKPYHQKLRKIPKQERKEALQSFLLKEPLEYEPGTKTVYSDLGFMLLQLIIEASCGMSMENIVETIYGLLGISDIFYSPLRKRILFPGGIAVTSIDYEKGLKCGIVHDENAAMLGGIAAHAGLFGTAGAVFLLISEIYSIYTGAGHQDVIPESTARMYLNPSCPGERTLGFDVPSGINPSCGRHFNRDSTIGHLGFTGTSFWIDLSDGRTVVLLTNRVHPSEQNQRIKEFRPQLHDIITESWES